jgi:glycogen debranching enzyme
MHRIALRARANQHVAYSGQSLLVTNLEGCVTGQGTEGFYFENTRLLCRDDLTANGMALQVIAVSPVRGHGMHAYALVSRDAHAADGDVVMQISHFVGPGMRTVLRVENFHRCRDIHLDLAIHLAADFADWDEAGRGERQQTAPVTTTWDEARREIRFQYHHVDLDRAVAVRVEQSPVPARFDDGTLVFSLTLPPHGPVAIHLVVEPIFDGQRHPAPPATFDDTQTSLGRVRRQLRDGAPRLITTNLTVARAWQTAVADLASLPLGLSEGPAAPIAGLPVYQQFFGRDTLTIGWQALLAMPTILRDALRANAARQGTTTDAWRDEEPGKMIHQARWGPLSLLGIDAFARYYGDYATPPDFLIMLGQYLTWTNDRATVRALLPAARKAIQWLERAGDADGDGFLEYVTRSEQGVKNQGWKDSWDAITDERGQVVPNPIATCELQAYWYAGLQQAALAFLALGALGEAGGLFRKMRALKRRFDTAFWMEDEGYYALALGPDKRPIRSISSNAGHLLACGIVPPEKGVRLARRLMQPDMFSGWGIRTFSSDHPSYNPVSYHLGSVWPVENGTIALGFARYGCWDELHRLAEGIFAATDLFVENRLPEVIGGFPRDAAHPHPGVYPGANEPQGWSDSAIVLIVQALLGILPIAPLGVLLIDPHLPPWLSDLRLEGIRVGQSRLDLAVTGRPEGRSRYRVTGRDGRTRVLRQLAPQAPGIGLGARVLTALGSLASS